MKPESALEAIFARLVQRRLSNGMTVCLLPSHQAPLVMTGLWYRAGARHESADLGGAAHFLEHMMFKGSERYGPGELDRRTQLAGGANNAFTGHDATSYSFSFSADRWIEALDFEADRMAGLILAEEAVDSERRVIAEEISMYEDDPWDSLELELQARYYGAHPYGRPILGTRESLARVGREELANFHRQHYRPANAVLVVAGDVDESVFDEVEQRFGVLGEPSPTAGEDGKRENDNGRRSSNARPSRLERFEQRRGQMARLLVALAAPPADHPDYAPLCMALWVLAGGRASRLHRALVDEGQLCVAVAADATEMVDSGMTVIAAEPVPGADRGLTESRIFQELVDLAESASPTEIERARRLFLSDWVFGLERIEHLGMMAGSAVTLFDADYGTRLLGRMIDANPETVAEAARRYLAPHRGGVVAWSVPE